VREDTNGVKKVFKELEIIEKFLAQKPLHLEAETNLMS